MKPLPPLSRPVRNDKIISGGILPSLVLRGCWLTTSSIGEKPCQCSQVRPRYVHPFHNSDPLGCDAPVFNRCSSRRTPERTFPITQPLVLFGSPHSCITNGDMETVTPEGDGMATFVLVIIMLVICWPTVITRCILRSKLGALGLDDHLMVLGLVCAPATRSPFLSSGLDQRRDES